jgi:S1-C subfamily serine protease
MEHSSTAVEVLASNLQSLTDDLNLDWVRFPPSESSPYQRIAPVDQLPATGFVTRASVPALDKSPAEIDKAAFKVAQKFAEATTVRIEGGKYSNGRDKVWSGVLISPNGLIATCAHTMQLPGDRLTVTLPNGKKVAAKALGANWVSDVGVVQIIEEGPWEYAELGDSSLIPPEGAVLCAGFPFPQAPPVTTEIFSLQRTPYVGWAKDMSFAPSMTLSGGASGGGVFDANGRLAAIYAGPGHGHRVELLRAQLDDLTKEKEILVEQPHQ